MEIKKFLEYARVIEKYQKLLEYLMYEIELDYDNEDCEIYLNAPMDIANGYKIYSDRDGYITSLEKLETNLMQLSQEYKILILTQINDKQKEIKNLKKLLNEHIDIK